MQELLLLTCGSRQSWVRTAAWQAHRSRKVCWSRMLRRSPATGHSVRQATRTTPQTPRCDQFAPEGLSRHSPMLLGRPATKSFPLLTPTTAACGGRRAGRRQQGAPLFATVSNSAGALHAGRAP